MDNIPDLSFLESELGTISVTKSLCPGIYYLIAGQDGEPVAAEYYAVADTSIISRQAKAYGKRISD